MFKPGNFFQNSWSEFLTMNDSYPEYPQYRRDCRFYNEDIYVIAAWKPFYGPGRNFGSTYCALWDVQVYSSAVGEGGNCIMDFANGPANGKEVTVRVSILVE
jgi:hypothetical protein